MRCSRWSSLALSALSALAAAAPATAATLATADGERLGLVRADGTGREVHGPAGVLLTNPSWAPDGQRLVVYATRRPGTERERRGLAIVRADGTGLADLRGGSRLFDPAWSPDGVTIAAVRFGEGDEPEAQIVALPAAGGTARVITRGSYDGSPAWSPDGTRLAFSRTSFDARGLPTTRLMVAAADGSGAHAVSGDGDQPAWSPDGTRIAYVSYRDRNGQVCFEECATAGELYVVGADGGDDRRLTRTKADESGPAWSPDGTRLAYASDRGSVQAGYELFSADPDGGCITQVTWAAGEVRTPAWRPGSEPVERGPCGTTAVPYGGGAHLQDARLRMGVALYLGDRYGDMLLNDFGAAPITYAECAGFNVTRCSGPIVMINQTVCDFGPEQLPRAGVVRTVRGALVLVHGRERLEVVSGGTTTVIALPARRPLTAAAVERLVAALRPVGRPAEPLPRPRLTRRAIARLRSRDRRIIRALARLGALRGPQPACAR